MKEMEPKHLFRLFIGPLFNLECIGKLIAGYFLLSFLHFPVQYKKNQKQYRRHTA
jgi:hypothetical protein